MAEALMDPAVRMRQMTLTSGQVRPTRVGTDLSLRTTPSPVVPTAAVRSRPRRPVAERSAHRSRSAHDRLPAMTWRGRRALLGATAVSIAAAVVLSWAVIMDVLAARSPIPASAPARVLVRPGDTVWAIARRVASGSDPRAAVDRILAENHLTGQVLQPGVWLRVR